LAVLLENKSWVLVFMVWPEATMLLTMAGQEVNCAIYSLR
jgi:hypothetical protein